MGVTEADLLQKLLEDTSAFPIWSADPIGGIPGVAIGSYAQVGSYGKSMRDLALWVAIREGDREGVTALIDWDRDRKYYFDPLPGRIAQAYSDLLFGEDPEFKASKPGDQDNLDEMVEANDLPSELRRWTEDSVSEGEVWWRVYVDRDISDWPIVDSSSRLDVVPYFVGRRVVAAAFIDTILPQTIMVEGQSTVVLWRHIEIQTEGYVRNLLYRGTMQALGSKMNLSELMDTRDLPAEWDHGLPVMLAGRIPNKLGRDRRLGVSEFQGVRDLILALNEARTVMVENARLTSKSRMVAPASAFDEDGNFKAGEDVIVAESLDENLEGSNTTGPYAVLEYKFQADPILKYMNDLVAVILTRCGLAEQFIGGSKAGEGQAYTGTALRTRLIPTTLAAAGKGRFWDDSVPKILRAMQMVSALATENGGCGQSWSDAETAPSMDRSTVLPEDENEETQRLVMAVQGEIMSVYTALKGLHPDWEDDDLKQEQDRIREDRAAALPEVPGGGVPRPGDPAYTPDRRAAEAVAGSRQPGVAGSSSGPDGQSPGKRAAVVPGGGPK